MYMPQANVLWAVIEMQVRRALHGVLENTIKATPGLFFTALQTYKYIEAPFTTADLAYGSTFTIAVGFRGLPMQKVPNNMPTLTTYQPYTSHQIITLDSKQQRDTDTL
jgi:hypothetical protein